MTETHHFYGLIRVYGSLYVWYVFLKIVAGKGLGGSGEFSVLKASLTWINVEYNNGY